MVSYTFNPGPPEAEGPTSEFEAGQPELHSKTSLIKVLIV